jgi:hypothetical protein
LVCDRDRPRITKESIVTKGMTFTRIGITRSYILIVDSFRSKMKANQIKSKGVGKILNYLL